MSRETFDDEEVTRRLNDGFVSIKIDRQERPDIDHYYMTACLLMGRQGGWPLSVLAFPDGRPFYTATYLPPRSSAGHVGLLNVLDRVGHLWSTQREALDATADEIHSALDAAAKNRETGSVQPVAESVDRLVHRALDSLTASFDSENGGFGGAPKFPTFQHLRFLLRMGPEAATMVSRTLERMLSGGIWDHVGGGIHRYSVDADWHEPHFEKMLHDQAGLLRTLAEYRAVTGSDAWKDEVRHVLDLLQSAFRTPDGLYYSALDADTEGQEGLFYTWTRDELASALSPSDAEFAAARLGVGPTGRHVLDRNRSVATQTHDAATARRLSGILARLAEKRATRSVPFRDENILVDWNGMVLSALSATARYMASDRAFGMALELGESIWTRFHGRSHLKRRGFLDDTGIDAQLDDYAWLIEGYLELTQVSGSGIWLEKARILAMEAVERLWDPASGSFLMASSSDVPLRLPKLYDEAYESGTAIMLRNLGWLLALHPDARLEAVRSELEETLRHVAESAPTGYTGFLSVLIEEHAGRGTIRTTGAGAARSKALGLFAPDLFLLHDDVTAVHESIGTGPLPEGMVQVCRNRTCDLPARNVDAYRFCPPIGPS